MPTASRFPGSAVVDVSWQLAPTESRIMLGPTVNRQPGFRRGLVEQSNAPKNTACYKLDAAAICLPTCLIS